MKGICILSVIPCRAEGNDRSEIVTQLLFGETYEVLNLEEKWVQIKTTFEGYEAWICIKQHHEISEESYESLSSLTANRVLDNYADITLPDGTTQTISLGANFPSDGGTELIIDGEKYSLRGTLGNFPSEKICSIAKSYLNTPYLWGGRSLAGIDCSGFSQIVYKLIGIDLPRDAYQQVEIGTSVELENVQKGDLAYFNNPSGRITHVGIFLDEKNIIHASGKVRIDKCTSEGIEHNSSGKLTHVLHSIKRVLSD